MKGLVLEGGGVKGSYQIGAFYAFKDCNIKLNGFVGTSIGSFNAAMLASGKAKELLRFWYNVNPRTIFGFGANIDETSSDLKVLINDFTSLAKIIKNFGIDNSGMIKEVNKLISYEDLKNSIYDFGLVTVRVTRKGITPCYVNKEGIKNKEELVEYLMASCYFPGFKPKRIIDNHYYIDGGFYDNSPVKLLADKGYEEVYVINVKGIGINRKNPKNTKVIHISPSRDTGKIFEMDTDIIKDNIMMGYYDALRVIMKLDGYKYCFKVRSDGYYRFLTRKVNKKLLRRVMNFFKTETIKQTVIKALEYVLEREEVDYYDVYNAYKLIKKFRKLEKDHFVYTFIKCIRFI